MATKQVKVHSGGCTPDTLELTADQDQVVFVQGDSKAPAVVHVDRQGLFGTSTCSVGANASAAPVYTPRAPGNFTISLAAPGSNSGPGSLKVLCLGPSKGMVASINSGGTGSIKVTG